MKSLPRILLPLFLILSVPSFARAQATVSGHAILPSGTAPASVKICFSLQGYKPNVPKVTGTGVVLNPLNFCINANVDGTYSTPLWGNDSISPAGTLWRVDFIRNGIQESSATFNITGGANNLDTLTPVVTTPVPSGNILGAKTFVWTQASASTSWAIPHNFGNKFVIVQCDDPAGNLLSPTNIFLTDANDVTVTFASPQTGSCTVMNGGNVAITTNIGNAIVSNPNAPQTISNYPLTVQTNLSANQVTTTVPTGTAPLVVASTTQVANLNASQLGGKTAPTGSIVGTTDAQALSTKTFDISANTLKNSTNTAGHYPRNNGTQYVDATIAGADVPATTSNCSGVQFSQGLNAGLTPVCATPPTFVASGASHAVGYVPDPGSSAGTTRFLREDATWVAPSANVSFTRKALASNVSFSTNTLQTIDSITISSWPGCGTNGCRVRVYYSYMVSNGNVTGQCYVGDGTNTYAESGETTSGSQAFCSTAAISPTQFSSNSGSVTFTVSIFNSGNGTVQTSSTFGTAVASYLEVEVILSN